MRAYTDDYLIPPQGGREGEQAITVRAHKSAARRSCCIIVSALILMFLAIAGIITSIIPPLQMFFLWYEVRYTIIGFSVMSFFSAVLMLLVVCMPRSTALFAVYLVVSAAAVVSLGALSYFFIEHDLSRMGSSWEDSFNDKDYGPLCDFERTIKCQGWAIPCGQQLMMIGAANDTTTTAITATPDVSTTEPATSETSEQSTVVSTLTTLTDSTTKASLATVTATSTTMATTTTTEAPARNFCPPCDEGAVDPSWPLCASEFAQDIRMGMPVVVTFSGLVTILLVVVAVFSRQVRDKSNARRRGALLTNTENYL